MLFTSQCTSRRKAKCAYMNFWQWENFRVPDSDKATPWHGGSIAGCALCLLRKQLSAVDHNILKFQTVKSKFKVHRIHARAHWLRVGDCLWNKLEFSMQRIGKWNIYVWKLNFAFPWIPMLITIPLIRSCTLKHLLMSITFRFTRQTRRFSIALSSNAAFPSETWSNLNQ